MKFVTRILTELARIEGMSHNPFAMPVDRKKDTVKITLSGAQIIESELVYFWPDRPVTELQTAAFRIKNGLPYFSLREGIHISLDGEDRNRAIEFMDKEIRKRAHEL